MITTRRFEPLALAIFGLVCAAIALCGSGCGTAGAPRLTYSFVGDSITAYGRWNRYFPTINTYNHGNPSDTTELILNRFQPILDERPDRAFFLAGINDLLQGYSDDLILDNYRTMLARFKAESPNTKLTVQSVMPIFHNTDGIDSSRIPVLNQKLRALAAEFGASYLDIFSPLADPATGDYRQEFFVDGYHPNADGYTIWVTEIRRMITAEGGR